ncbi:hypothetical protein [Photobacterium sp.]|uniref:hypothetical protein n=1 Tax=Photobacterium sp. TaxID=660 RepID=UPI00299EC902|nr:hypothetical protein [Photobacterium sp.]MDX1300727.1 hypothetical protein [Photobacterium sp.]
MIRVNFELAKQAYGKVLKYPYGGEIEQHEYQALRVFKQDLARAGMPIDSAFDLRLKAAGYRNIATRPAKAHRPLPACVLNQMSKSWKHEHGYY